MSKLAVSPIEELRSSVGQRWSSLSSSRSQSEKKFRELEALVRNHGFFSEDAALVTFGSLARQEWTSHSDLDWLYLIDGQSHPEHLEVTQQITKVLEKSETAKPPGPTATFGTMASSHDLVHHIGGQEDTNKNTTRRLLLILESRAIGSNDAYERVMNNILRRYVEADTNLLQADNQHFRVPRFLLNDILRFWRTMAVDFAQKMREREDDGWGLRNIKLRMSRKLLAVAGLLACFSCTRVPVPRGSTPELHFGLLATHLRNYVRLTPLEILAESMLAYKADKRVVRATFSAYDEFLAVIDNPRKRRSLQDLRPDAWQSNKLFNHLREVSHDYQDALIRFFFMTPRIAELTREYGLF